MRDSFHFTTNGKAFRLQDIPEFSSDEFLQKIITETASGWRVLNFFGAPNNGALTLYAVLGARREHRIGVMKCTTRQAFPSITGYVPQVHLFERELAEKWAITPEGHPWLKPVRYTESTAPPRMHPGVTDYYRVNGDEVHEVAVGPVHAGIIEPGHFRFQCHGEKVFHLEISLGYQHRGVEAALTGGPHPTTIHQLETTAGDTTIGHTLAYCMIMEGLGNSPASPRGDIIRAIALELERLANHTGDLGALAGDVGYLPTMSYCGRIRGDFLNMTALLCGNRFGRGLVRPGGTAFDIDSHRVAELRNRLASAESDLQNAVDLLWHSTSTMARFERTGKVSQEAALELGLVGPAARACGIMRDVRSGFPFGAYSSMEWQPATDSNGDVYARAMIRWLECRQSLHVISSALAHLPGGVWRCQTALPAADSMAIALTEGWRGEICHTAITDAAGRFSTYKIVDPSFHNWTGLAMALRGEHISDFPLCNKSFNLSYCGFDL